MKLGRKKHLKIEKFKQQKKKSLQKFSQQITKSQVKTPIKKKAILF
jgi:hypothetical protein